jgi:beta-lactam-binding protein with PASTA domain
MTANRSVRAVFAKAFTPPRCVVPKVLGKTVAGATKALRRAHCRLGKVTRVPSIRSKIGKVLRQSPRAGRRLASGSKVSLAVGRGPAKKK